MKNMSLTAKRQALLISRIFNRFIATRRRKILSLTLISLITLTSIRFIFLPIEEVKADSLIKFNEGYGTTVNDDGANVSGTITNAVWKTEDLCFDGKCLFFDGSGDLVNFGDDADLDFVAGDSFTLEGWFRTGDISSGQRTIIAKYNGVTGTDGGYKVYMDSNGYLIFAIDNDQSGFPSDSVSTSTKVFDDNRWHHFAGVKSGTSSITIYVDGYQYATDSTITNGSLVNSDTFYIGIDGDGSSNGWLGFIDEVKVYRSARTTAEIKADFLKVTPNRGTSASFSPDNSFLSDGLVGYWKLDETSGNASDSSGNANTLTNNGTTTFVGGKFGNGGEHVPASAQYFSSAGTSTYYFDLSDAGPTDPNAVWGNDANAFDGSTSTYAETFSNGSTSSNYLKGEGTNSSASGDTITSVEARVYGYANDSSGQPEVDAAIYTDNQTQNLGTPIVDFGPGWGSYLTLSTPTGGWTWSKVQALETLVYGTGGTSAPTYRVYRVEIRVNTSSSINGVKSVSFWTNPDSTTNYYISLTSGAYITSSSGTLSATGFTNPKIYVNGVATTSIAADLWQFVTVTDDTAINADQFYMGRQGSNYFDGTMDEVRLYNRGLTPAEVQKLYNWAPGPAAYWKLDENTGTSTTNDSSGNGNTGTLTSMTESSWIPGKYGSALTFDGTADYITADGVVGEITGSNHTIEAWIKTTTGSAGSNIMFGFNDAPSGNRYVIYPNASLRLVVWNPTEGAQAGSISVGDGNWHHIAVAVNDSANTVTTYVDGVIDLNAATFSASIASTDLFSIGQEWDSGPTASDFYNGQMDDVRIYNYLRTPAQIIEDMNAGHPAPGSPIGSAVAHWKFNEGALNTCSGGTNDFCDTSINVNDLAFSGSSGGFTNSGKFGKALNATGAIWATRADDDDFDFAAADDLSVSLWFKADAANKPSAGNVQYLYTKGTITSAGTVGYIVYTTSGGNAVFGIRSTSGNWVATPPAEPTSDDKVTSTTDLYDSQWHHIVATKIGTSRIDLYVDGKLNASDTSLAATGTLANSIASRFADRDAVDNGDEFIGSLDEMKIYRLALTTDQVKVLYNQTSGASVGSISTDASGNPSWSANDEYCPPGQGSTCTAPVGHWKLDENTGTTIFDQMGSGGDPTFGAGANAPQWAPGKLGSAVLFDGSDDYATENNTAPVSLVITGDLTVSAWIYRRSTTNTQTIIHVDGSGAAPGGNRSYQFVVRNAPDNQLRLAWEFGSVPTAVTINSTVSLTNNGVNNWLHVAAVRDTTAKTVTFYENGRQLGGVVSYTDDPDGGTNSPDIAIGATNDAPSGTFDGYIDDVRVYNYIRTPAQIAWDYNRGGPIGHWKFNECSGTLANDNSGNGNNGTIVPGAGTHTSVGTCNSGSASEMWDDGITGKRIYSLDFDGNDDYVDMNDVAIFDFNDQSFSIAGWFNRETFTTDDTIVAKKNDQLNSSAGFVVWIDDATDDLRLVISDGDSTNLHTLDSTSNFTSTGWNHFVIVYDDSSATASKIYVNGRDDNATNTTTGTFSLINNLSNAVDFRIGGESDTATDTPFAGELDDIMIFNYLLTAQQAREIFAEGATRFGPLEGSPQ